MPSATVECASDSPLLLEYRLPIGLFGMILVAIIVLSIANVGGSAVSQLVDLLKGVLGGVIGGAIVSRALAKLSSNPPLA